MTVHYLALPPGGTDTIANVTHGTSVPTGYAVYLAYDDSKEVNAFRLFQAIEAFEHYLNSNGIQTGSGGTDLPHQP